MPIDPEALAFEIASVICARSRDGRAAAISGRPSGGYFVDDDFEANPDTLRRLAISGGRDDLVAIVQEALQRLEATAGGAAAGD